MIRPFTCLCLLVAAGSGLYLYSAKHDAQMLDREITRLSKQAQDSRSRAALMRAEYDRLGDPDRLRELASLVLALQPTDPAQFTAMADLDKRLLIAGAAVQANIGAVVEAPLVIANIAEPPARPPVQAAAPALAVVALLAAAKPVPAAPRPAPALAPVTAPIATQQPAPTAAPSVLAAAQQASPQTPPRVPLIRQAAAVENRPAPRPAPAPIRAVVAQEAPATAPVFASALGMARTQAPLPANAITPTSYTPAAARR